MKFFIQTALVTGGLLFIVGCANITVTKVTPKNQAKVTGIRYSLPKPFIQVTPQADGSASVDVVYLPDSDETYAIDTSGWLSSSTFQVALDSGGLLSAVEFKQNTSAVGQQLALSSGAATAQIYNLQAAQTAVAQAALNTAQGSTDTATAARNALQAQLGVDTKILDKKTADNAAIQKDPNATQSQKDAAAKAVSDAQAAVNKDTGDLAQAEAKFEITQQVLDRARTTAQASSVTASAASPIATSAPTPSTSGFGPQAWAPLPLYNLPEKYGAVLFAVKETPNDNDPRAGKLDLLAVNGPDKTQQSTFETAFTGVGAPSLLPQNMRYPAGAKNAIFLFSRPIESVTVTTVLTGTPESAVNAKPAVLDSADKTKLTQPLDNLGAGQYKLQLNFVWGGGRNGLATVTFGVY
ncbi:MAG: hypothetical protein JWM68_3671 [Verrucomicrobiales bacterium]|nr:hypothetical protein [Verrucomicrobiales bacterium]